MQIINVDKKYDGKKLNTILFDKFPGLTLDTFYKALRKKDIRINNVRTNKNDIIHFGDEIKIFIIDNLLYHNFIPDIVYEDSNIIIINKPANIEVTGDNLSLTQNLKSFIQSRDSSSSQSSLPFIEPCHRLDRNTTGLILFAKNKEALDILLYKFKNQEIEKHYIAKVYGIPSPDTQTLTAYLFKDNKKSLAYISDVPQKGYVKIVTSYTILHKYIKENYSILDVTLHTGKTHQIRAHLAHIGYPILGDGKYGINKINKQFGFDTQQLCSYILKFNFSDNNGILDYLSGKTIKLKFDF